MNSSDCSKLRRVQLTGLTCRKGTLRPSRWRTQCLSIVLGLWTWLHSFCMWKATWIAILASATTVPLALGDLGCRCNRCSCELVVAIVVARRQLAVWRCWRHWPKLRQCVQPLLRIWRDSVRILCVADGAVDMHERKNIRIRLTQMVWFVALSQLGLKNLCHLSIILVATASGMEAADARLCVRGNGLWGTS